MAEQAHLSALRNKSPGYAEDYAAWVDHQVALMQQRRAADLDYDHLIDEVMDLGKSEYRQFATPVEIIIAHMLKWDYQSGHRTRSWQGSIVEHRRRVDQALRDSPSFRRRIDGAIADGYAVAVAVASRETNLPLKTFPLTCPYDWDAITTREHRLPGDD